MIEMQSLNAAFISYLELNAIYKWHTKYYTLGIKCSFLLDRGLFIISIELIANIDILIQIIEFVNK